MPLGLFCAALTWRSTEPETIDAQLPVDVVGLVLLVIWVGALQIMLDPGKEEDWFDSTISCRWRSSRASRFVAFVIWELTDEHPIVDLSLFADRNFSSARSRSPLAFALFSGNVVLLPLWLQQAMGYTATWAGLVMAPVGIFAIILMPLVGKNMHRVDPRMVATGSMLVFGLSFGLRSQFTTQADLVTLLTPSFVQGIAVAMFFVPLTSITLSGLTPDRVPAASGLSNFMRMCAGAFGTSITTTLWSDRTAMHHAQMAESVTEGRAAADQALAALQSTGLDRDQSLAAINRLVDQQAYTLSATEIFSVSSLMFLVLLALVWYSRPPRPGAAKGAPAGRGPAAAPADAGH